MKPLQGTTQTLTRDIDMWQSHVALTRGSQHLRLTVNVQIELSGPILQRFIKLGAKFMNQIIGEPNLKIRDKLGTKNTILPFI